MRKPKRYFRFSIPPSDIRAHAYDVASAAKVIGVSSGSIYTLINEGKLHTVALAGRRLISAPELRRVIEEERRRLRFSTESPASFSELEAEEAADDCKSLLPAGRIEHEARPLQRGPPDRR